MSQDRYLFEIPPGTALGLGRAWLRLGVASLIGAGLLAVLLVLSRTPGIQDVFPLKDFFRAALIVHVDLSVLVWFFMAFAGVLWSLAGNNRFEMLGWAGFWLAVAGTVLIVVLPLPSRHASFAQQLHTYSGSAGIFRRPLDCLHRLRRHRAGAPCLR